MSQQLVQQQSPESSNNRSNQSQTNISPGLNNVAIVTGSSAKQREEFEQMLNEVRQRLEEKLKMFKEKQLTQNGKHNTKELQDLQQLAIQYKKLMEQRDYDLRDLEQLQNAEKELKTAQSEQQRVQLELQDLRNQLVQLQSEQRVLDQDIQIEDMRRQILERLKNLKEQIIKQKQNISDQGQQKVSKDLNEQIQLMQRYLSQIEQLEKQAASSIRQDLQRKIKEQEDDHNKAKQDLIQLNTQKQQFIKKLKEDIEVQKRKNDLIQQEKEDNDVKLKELRDQLAQLQQQKRDLLSEKEKELLNLQQESGQSEKSAVENFNKNNPQLNLLKQIIDQIKNRTAQLSSETNILKEDWERKKLRIESDQINEVNNINQKMIAKLSQDIDKLIKEKENETQKLRMKLQSLEQIKLRQEQAVDQETVDRLKAEYVQKYSQYKQAYQEKGQMYGQIADMTKDILGFNNEFIDKECNHAKKQLEKEIAKVTAENNDDQLRIINDKLYKSKEIEEAYLNQFGIYDKQIADLSHKLQDRDEDINQLEEILEDKDKYIDELKKEIEIQQAMKRRIQVIVPPKKPEKKAFQFPMKRLRQGEYLFAGKVINAKVSNGKLLFRTGGGYIMFDEFLHQYAKEQVAELRAFAESENLTLEEVLSKFEQHYIEEYTQGMTGTMSTALGKMLA
ncbi:gas2 domain containing protein [Stylonychia lemnae]|uniref:Gas2 domain containing protein n=1 Tax=Stylonychia lemnae TaxID=5949 RepID=A0A078AYG8_STYLE|nr:gas2 domain containing protein [Stylonychia lemnae]|eukprot:CDW85833.1 gas2 domain containing protein [Stylonychia lemnae]